MARLCVVLAAAALLVTAGCMTSSMSSKYRPREAEPPEQVKLAIPEPMPKDGSISGYDDVRVTASPISDSKAQKKGDIVTILISESMASNRATNTSTERDQTTNAAVTQLFFPHIGTLGGQPASVGYTSKRTANGNGQIADTNVVTGELAAQITEVLPNGNLVLRAKKSLRVAGEIQDITLTGITRLENISSANQVYSYDIAEARIQFQGTGPLSDAQKRTVATRLADFFNVF